MNEPNQGKTDSQRTADYWILGIALTGLCVLAIAALVYKSIHYPN